MTNIEKLIRNGCMAILVLSFAACSDANDKEEMPTTSAPTLKATIGDKSIETRAGIIIEDNENYKTEGEKFYWTSDDKVKVGFGMGNGQTLYAKYEADIANESDKSNTCDFAFSSDNFGPPPPGPYSVNAYFPFDGWDFSDPSYPTVQMPRYFYRTEVDSKYMGQYMYMTAQNDNVMITGLNDSFGLNFKNQVAVFRVQLKIYESFFSYYNEWTHKTVENRLERVTISIRDYDANPSYSIAYSKFPTKAEYINGKLVPVAGTTDSLSVIVDDRIKGISGDDFRDKIRTLPQHIDTSDGNKIYYIVDFFFPALPFEHDFSSDDEFKLTVQYKEVGSQGFRGVSRTAFWMTEFEHLAKGFKAGYSYFTTAEIKF